MDGQTKPERQTTAFGAGENYAIAQGPPVPDVPTYYTNKANTNATIFEVQIAFFLDRFTGLADRKEAKHLFNLVMSPQHAKALHETLGQVLAQYEAKMGSPIRILPTPTAGA